MPQQEIEAVYRALATKAMTQIARALRRRKLAGLKFRRQHPIAGTAYVVDFLCYSARLVVEVDGSIHDAQVDDDATRQTNIEALGYKVIRFRNDDIANDLQGVLTAIVAAAFDDEANLVAEDALTPGPSPSGRGVKFQQERHRKHSDNLSEATSKSAQFQLHTAYQSNSVLAGPPLPEGEGLGVRAATDDAL